jgi:hypothetical protein
MDLPTSLLTCLCGLPNAHPHPAPTTTQHKQYRLITEKPRLEPAPSTTTPNHDSNNQEGKTKNRDHSHDDERATKILTLIRTAPSPTTLTKQISNNVGPTTSWSEYLAERVLRGLEETLRWAQDHQADWGEALTEAYTRATELAREELRELWDYAKAHLSRWRPRCCSRCWRSGSWPGWCLGC